jgi:DNA-binding beta-propeller fold protein YncE
VRAIAKPSTVGSTGGADFGIVPIGALAICACLAIVAFLALTAAPALALEAGTSYEVSGAFGSAGAEPGQFKNPGHVAAEPTTGNVLVADSGNGRVQVFAPDGTYLTSFGSGVLTTPVGIAIDQATGAIYVSDSGVGAILKFSSDGAATPTYTQDLTFTSPAQGTGPGQVGSFASAIAVDPSSHDLLVADSGNKRLERFTSSGASVASFDGVASESGSLGRPLDIAVGLSGTVYVADTNGEPVFCCGISHLKVFTAGGAAAGELAAAIMPSAVAIDPASGDIFVSGGSGNSEVRTVYNFRADGTPLGHSSLAPGFTGGSFEGEVRGLAITGTGTAARLYALYAHDIYELEEETYGAPGVEILASRAIPAVAIEAPTALTSTSAHLSGKVAAGSEAASAFFEYSSDGVNWTPAPEQTVAAGPGEQTVEADLTLLPNTSYSVRLVAKNGFHTVTSSVETFDTLVSAPSITDEHTGDREPTTATLFGKLNAFGLYTTYHFEYGPTTAYGRRAPAGAEGPAGSSFVPRVYSRAISGLQPGTEYHFRLVATNSAGTTDGADATFTTPAAPEAPARVYEQVSPVDKGGANVESQRGFQATLDGDQIFYRTKSPIGDSSEYEGQGAPYYPLSLAGRGETNWDSFGVDPPLIAENVNPGVNRLATTLGASEDGSESLSISLKKLAPGAEEGDSNLYLRSSATREYTTILSLPGPNYFEHTVGLESLNDPYWAATPDFDHILLSSAGFALSPGTPVGALLDWTGGELQLVSVLPGGTPTAAHGVAISDDGSVIVFSTTNPGAANEGLFVRVDGAPSEPIPGEFVGATADGQSVFVTGVELTPNSEPGLKSLYRYDVGSGDLELLTVMGDPGFETAFVLATSDQVGENIAYPPPPLYAGPGGPSIYFLSRSDLAPGAVAGQKNIYAWHDGVVSRVATLEPGRDVFKNFRASPDGRYFALASASQLTAYDNSTTACTNSGVYEDPNPSACVEVYRYDADTGQLLCASCRPDEGPPTGSALLRPAEGFIEKGGHHVPRTMLDDGEVFFDTPDPLVGDDINGARDVYSISGQQPSLISSGKGAGGSVFADASADGRDVFFTTADRLVGQDDDSLVDLYDARIGGGLAAQNPPASPQGCIRDDCKSTPSESRELPFGGSESLTAPGKVKAARKLQCGKGRREVKTHGKARCVKAQKKHKKKATHKPAKRRRDDRKKADNQRRQGR